MCANLAKSLDLHGVCGFRNNQMSKREMLRNKYPRLRHNFVQPEEINFVVFCSSVLFITN